jgi:hypothetical protein
METNGKLGEESVQSCINNASLFFFGLIDRNIHTNVKFWLMEIIIVGMAARQALRLRSPVQTTLLHGEQPTLTCRSPQSSDGYYKKRK